MTPDLLRPAARSGVRRGAYLAIAAAGSVYRMIRGRPCGPVESAERILLIRLDLLGDVLFSLVAAEALRERYPEARITMLTLPYTAPLARLSPFLDEVLEVDTNRIRRPAGLLNPATWIGYWRTVKHLRSERFDACLSLSGPMASLWAFLSGARRTFGFREEAYPGLLTDPVPGGRYRERKHEVEYVRALAVAAGAVDREHRLHASVPPAARKRVERMLAAEGISPRDRLVVVHAGAVNGSAKRWPAIQWGPFIDKVCSLTSSRIVLIGGAGDASIAQAVQRASASPVVSLVGKTDIPELLAVVERADLVASGDSGPLHLAVALGRPLLAPYGPTDPQVHGPYRPIAPVRIHRRDLACSPCYSMAGTAECPLGDPICMRLVSVEEMTASALELLRETDAPS